MVSSDFHFLKHIIIHWRLCLYLLEMTQRRQNWISKQSVPKGQDRTFKCYQNVVFFAQFSFRTKFHWHWHFILNNYHILVGKAVWFYFFLFFIFFKCRSNRTLPGFQQSEATWTFSTIKPSSVEVLLMSEHGKLSPQKLALADNEPKVSRAQYELHKVLAYLSGHCFRLKITRR